MAAAGRAGARADDEDVVGETGETDEAAVGPGASPAAAPVHRSLRRYLPRAASGLGCQPSAEADSLAAGTGGAEPIYANHWLLEVSGHILRSRGQQAKVS